MTEISTSSTSQLPTPRLIEWDRFVFRIRGEKIAEKVVQAIREANAPLSDIRLTWLDGVMKFEARTKAAFVMVPVRMSVRRILVDGLTVRVPIEDLTAFGFPIPALLRRIAEKQVRRDGVDYIAETSTFVVRLDRFLPPFISVKIETVQIIEGGVGVILGPGSLDPPDGR